MHGSAVVTGLEMWLYYSLAIFLLITVNLKFSSSVGWVGVVLYLFQVSTRFVCNEKERTMGGGGGVLYKMRDVLFPRGKISREQFRHIKIIIKSLF